MLKKIILIIIFGIVGGAILVGLYFWNQVSLPVSASEDEIIFTIDEGEGVKEIGVALEDAELIRSAYWFEWYVYFDGSESEFKAGNHVLMRDMNMREIVHTLVSGETVPERNITILEGWNMYEIGAYLEKQGIVSQDDFVAAASTTDTRSIIHGKTYDFLQDKPDDQGLEGYLFPDTYRIFENATAADIITKMLDNFGQKFTQQMMVDAREKEQMDVYEIVTLASIIEKEIKINRDKKGDPVNNDHYIVAGVFYNRLRNNLPLESDATVNYITRADRPQPTAEDLTVDSPYNTYLYRGLPPGPIANPSLEALKAAVYPAETDYFYFLHKIHGDGSTVFSKTYPEHLKNKRKYLQ